MSENTKLLFKNDINYNNILKNVLSKLELIKPKINCQNNKNIKIRNPGIDLVRILGMYAIIIHHFIIFGDLTTKYWKYTEINFINILTFWHVNSFALISGIVGYKTNKYSNLLYLWFQVLFYSIGIYLVIKKYKPIWIVKNNENFYQYLFPVIFRKYWYFTQYFGMYLLLPVVNKGLSILTKTELKIVVFSTIIIYIIFKDLLTPELDTFKMAKGYSTIWLLILYIEGAYIGKYNKIYNDNINKSIFCVLCILIYIFSSLFCYEFSIYQIDKRDNYLKMIIIIILKRLFIHRINSMTMVIQTFSIILFFRQIKYHKNIAKIISFCGPLTFGIYLIHNHNLIKRNIIGNLFRRDSNFLSLNTIIKLCLIRGLVVIIICIIIDYIRNLIFIFCKIKNICILLEKKIYKLFN